MATCINCGKSGKKICDTCLEKVKKEKLIFLAPLQKDAITTIIEASKPKFEKGLVTTPTSKSNVPAVIKNDVIKPPVVKDNTSEFIPDILDLFNNYAPKTPVVNEEPKSTVQVESTSTTTRKTTSPTTTLQSTETTTTTTNNDSLDDGDNPRRKHYPVNYQPYRREKTVTAIIFSVIIVISILLVFKFLVPWNIGQWIVSISSGLFILFAFFIGAFLDDEFIADDVRLFLCTAINIVVTVWSKSNYSTISLVTSIALAVSSLIIMARAYCEHKSKQGHWALLCMAINIAFIFRDEIYVYIEPIYTHIIGLF